MVTKKFNGPARVLGGAGTGKTVVAMHRARYLARKVFPEKTDRILFTTYTANLAENVEQHLRGSVRRGDGADRGRPPARLGRAFHEDPEVDFQVATDEEIEQSWEEAQAVVGDPSFDTGFLRQEWD